MLAAAGEEGLEPGADVAEPGAAKHDGGGGIVVGDVGLEPVEVEIGQRPAGEAACGFGRDAMAPEAAAEPVTEMADSGLKVEAQADAADQHLAAGFVSGDGEVIGGAALHLLDGEGDPFVGERAGVGEGELGEHADDLPIVDEAVDGVGVAGSERAEGEALGGERFEGGGRGEGERQLIAFGHPSR